MSNCDFEARAASDRRQPWEIGIELLDTLTICQSRIISQCHPSDGRRPQELIGFQGGGRRGIAQEVKRVSATYLSVLPWVRVTL